MADPVARPSYYDGQVLRSADLSDALDHGSGQVARHERYLHLPGIAAGLGLSMDQTTNQAKLAPGVAIDGTGREIVVDHEETLSADDFARLSVALPGDQNKGAWYPVFLSGRDEPQPAAPLGRGCATGAAPPTRISEVYDLSFGRPGDEAEDPLQGDPPAFSDGPGTVDGARVVVGFVQWDPVQAAFSDAQTSPPGHAPQWAGVRADAVVARGGVLALRTRLPPGKPAHAVTVDSAAGLLSFGPQDKAGEVQAVFKVDAAGNVTASGTIKSLVPSGVAVESGLAFDGLPVPLPSGIARADVDEGRVAVHVQLTPLYANDPRPPDPTPGTWMVMPLECRLDGGRVACRYRWIDTTNLANVRDAAGACRYVVLTSGSGA